LQSDKLATFVALYAKH